MGSKRPLIFSRWKDKQPVKENMGADALQGYKI
jgi:hypothetical protein